MKEKNILVVAAIGLLLVSLSACSKPNEQQASIEVHEVINVTDENGDKLAVPETTPLTVKVFEGKQEKVAIVEDVAVYEEYNNKVLSGTQVSAALTKFKGKRVAVLVATQMVMDSTTAYNATDGNVSTDTPTVGATGVTGLLNTSGKDMADRLTFVNYGTVLKGTEGKAMIKFETDHYVSEDGLDGSKDKYVTNGNITNATTPGSAENIAEYLRLQSYLVKDSKGDIIGIACYVVK